MEFKKDLKRGDKGEDCKILQQNLHALEFYKAGADGLFGPKTEASVKSFQRKNRLKVDGIVGRKTMDRINTEMKGVSNVEKVRHTINSNLDLSQIKELDPNLPLKVAVLREGKVLESKVIDLKDVEISSIPVEISYEGPKRDIPLGVTFAVGPDVPDEEFVGINTHNQWISPKDTQWKGFKYDLKKIIIPGYIYPWWWGWCRTYTIRGQVVCADGSPVPGAQVEAFDIDSWWWWCGKSSVGSAITEADGTFEIEFRWCCWWWLWWRPLPLLPLPPKIKVPPPPVLKDWVIDPYLVEKIVDVLQKIPEIGPIPRPDPTPNLDQVKEFAQRLELGLPEASKTTPRMSSPDSIENIGRTLVERLPSASELKMLHVWPWWPWLRRDCKPDIIFTVKQDCVEPDTVIYEETCSDTRWNIPALLEGITLVANDDACCGYDPEQPVGECFVFGQVGCTSVDNIGGNDPMAPVPPELLGYADPNGDDRPFGETLSITGVFGDLADVDYYTVQFSTDGVSYVEMTDTMMGNFYRKYWGPPPGAVPADPPQWNTVWFKKDEKLDTLLDSHWVFKSREKYETENPCPVPGPCWGSQRIWTFHSDLLIRWISAQLPDGLYYLQVVGYDIDGSDQLINRRVLPLCNEEEEATLIIRIDNRGVGVGYHAISTPAHPCGSGTVHLCTEEPDCDFKRIVKNEDRPDEEEINPCDIVRLNPADTLTIHYNVSVPPPVTDGHLGGYSMSAHYGESGHFDVLERGELSGDLDPHYGPTYNKALEQGPWINRTPPMVWW